MTLSTQFYTMLAMVGMGSWLGAALDTYGRFLQRPKRARWLVFINDIFFWALQGLLFFYSLLMVNEGEFRVYILLAVLCGFAAYQSLIKKIYLWILEKAIQITIQTYRLFLKIGRILLINPVYWIFQMIFLLILGILKFLWNILIWLFKFVFSFVKILLKPLVLIGKLLVFLIPKSWRNRITQIYKKIAGFLIKRKNVLDKLSSWYTRLWKKK
ncbi:spore cortex biosynthesis protein YabQ [Metabacillus arenae]|uniref:Spore cortex biosynthesis protein YabQ n=1 Tax=Metabacillus arenae TaxID=2771434 RepID=A0A926RZT9_9BACI|nr:spore cortex biosynthesis protein YabQ [Metabacillus arenae]MBD1383180.1 spore cortex biosynthesis protein YabQ [Metabacillus arenae]